MSDWIMAGVGMMMDIALAVLAFIFIAAGFVLLGWPLLVYTWHYWMG